MRIISKFKDYYDGVQGLGIDLSTVFLRETKVYNYKKPICHGLDRLRCYKSLPFSWYTYDIVFCNKPYQIHKLIKRHDHEEKHYFSSERDVNTFLGINYKDSFNHGYNIFLNKTFDYDEPIVIFPPDQIVEKIINGNLGDIHFQKIKDPYTAFQEINQFITNRANPEPFVPELTNKDKISSKGFDLKYSFRYNKK